VKRNDGKQHESLRRNFQSKTGAPFSIGKDWQAQRKLEPCLPNRGFSRPVNEMRGEKNCLCIGGKRSTTQQEE